MDNNFIYQYIKLRKGYGRQPMFCEVGPVMLDSINPNKLEQKVCGLRNPVHQGTQTGIAMSEHYINTKRPNPRNQGVNHAEGGWPKDVNFNDEEATIRYRRRFERDDEYIHAVLSLQPKLNHFINQNNAIEMYNMYFKEMNQEQPVEKSSVRVTSVLRDPTERHVASISWTYEDESKVVVCYCNKKYPVLGPLNKSIMCHVWNIDNPNEPYADFLPPTACWQGVCFPGSPSIIIGGLEDGRVCLFDIRSQKTPTMISPMHLAHRDPVSALMFMHARQNTEFFSGSTDGKCMWWDVRNISNPTDTLIMSVFVPPGESISLANAEGVSALQYDRSFPTKFLCGTDTGLVINVNRKGKSHSEMMSSVYEAHNGPVKSINRSPCTSKVFISCGDWTAHVWCDEVHSAPIITGIAHRYQILDVIWAPQRVSSYMCVSADGKFRYWDLLRKYREPLYVLPVSKYPLLKVAPNETGKLVAAGDVKGTTYILSLSKNLVVSANKDKQLMMQTLDREIRREHIIESRIKEIKLKLKTDAPKSSETEIVDEQAVLKSVEDEYRKMTSDEMRRRGVTTQYAGQAMRKR